MAETVAAGGASSAGMPAAAAGLRDVVALASSITSIEDGVLRYRGINIDELAENASFEEVIHLLWHGAPAHARRAGGAAAVHRGQRRAAPGPDRSDADVSPPHHADGRPADRHFGAGHL